MRYVILILAFCLFAAAAPASAQLAWPILCLPAHEGIPEHCGDVSRYGTAQGGITIYDPATGYQAPDELVIADATIRDAWSVFTLAWGNYYWGLHARHDSDRARALGIGQVNELTWLAANSAARDPLRGLHQTWAPRTMAWPYADLTAHCGPAASTRCRAAVEFAAYAETASNGGLTSVPGLSYSQLEAMFQAVRGGAR